MKYYSKLLSNNVIRNTFSLFAVQFILNFTSLLLVPYLSRKLNDEHWGVYLISQSLMFIITPFLDFGFDFFATRQVAINRSSNRKLNYIIKGTYSAKLLLTVIVLIAFLLMLNFHPIFISHPKYLIFSVICGILSSYTPWWYFQGIEKVTKPSILTILLILMYAVLVFIFVSEETDGWKVFLFYALINVILNLYLFYEIQKKTGKIIFVTRLGIKSIMQSFPLFAQRFIEIFVNNSTNFILGFFIAPVSVSYYGNCEKIMKIPNISINILIKILFPKFSLFNETKNKNEERYRRIIIVISMIGGVLISLFVYLYADTIVKIIFGREIEVTISLLRVFIWTLPFFIFNKLIGALWLLASKKEIFYLKLSIFSAILYFASFLTLFIFFDLIGVVIAYLLTEIVKTSILVFVLIKKHKIS